MDEKPDKERSDVPEPLPIVIGGVRYEAVPWGKARGLGQNGGYIAAVDEATNRELWILKVYEVTYDGEREDDKQDVFIEDLALGKDGLLRVTDERGGIHLVDVRARRLVRA
jgi:hypothetical protein